MALFYKLSLVLLISFAHLSMGKVVKQAINGKLVKKETMTQAEILAEADPESRLAFMITFISGM